MIGSMLGTAPPSAPEQPREGGEDRLMEASLQLEGVFIQYLMKALRNTIPDQGNPDAPGADLYGSLLDEHLAQVAANDTRTGIAEALYRQLTHAARGPILEGNEG